MINPILWCLFLLNKFLFRVFSSFLFPEFKIPWPFHRNLHLIKARLALFFHPSFYLIILLSPEFFMVVLHDLIHSSRVHQEFCWRSSSIFLIASRSAIKSLYSFEVEFCISSFFSVIQSFLFVAGYHLMTLRCYL